MTTHWKYAHLLHEKLPGITVNYDSCFIKDLHIYTSGGITSGIDLTLKLVEEDFSKYLSSEIAKHLVLPNRQYTQNTYSSLLPSTSEYSTFLI